MVFRDLKARSKLQIKHLNVKITEVGVSRDIK